MSAVGPLDWRATGKPVRLTVLDMRATIGVLIPLLNPYSAWMWLLGLCVVIALGVLSYWGLTPEVLGRRFRIFLGGRRSAAVAWWQRPERRFSREAD